MTENSAQSQTSPIFCAVGLMSGTSLDGIDAALIYTDGERRVEVGPAMTFPYAPDFRKSLRNVLGRSDIGAPDIREVTDTLTRQHAAAVSRLLADHGVKQSEVDLIGFHGHTIVHRPDESLTVQIGDGHMLAQLTGIDVMDDFRTADMAAGGQGAPLAPLYHAARAGGLKLPVAVLNIGGVANVTFVNGLDARHLVAFDTGPGNALIDDWAMRSIDRPMDEGGRLARSGRVDQNILGVLCNNAFFSAPPPKSLDRDDFADALQSVASLSGADGAATLSALSVEGVVRACAYLPQKPLRWLVCGGGRRNAFLMEMLAEHLGVAVVPVEDVGWRGDFLEAEAFAYLAVRAKRGLPLSLPGTTGVRAPATGGTLHLAAHSHPTSSE